MRLQESLQLGFQTGIHGVAAGTHGQQEGQVKALHLFAVDQDLIKCRGSDHVLGLVFAYIFAHLLGIETGDQCQLQAQGQGHVDTAHQTVGGEDGHDAQEALSLFVDNAGVNEIKGNSIHAVVGEHNALGEAGGTAGVGDSNSCIALILYFLCNAVLGAGNEGIPADDATLAKGNGALGSNFKCEFFQRG